MSASTWRSLYLLQVFTRRVASFAIGGVSALVVESYVVNKKGSGISPLQLETVVADLIAKGLKPFSSQKEDSVGWPANLYLPVAKIRRQHVVPARTC